jgi:hypothetical protein
MRLLVPVMVFTAVVLGWAGMRVLDGGDGAAVASNTTIAAGAASTAAVGDGPLATATRTPIAGSTSTPATTATPPAEAPPGQVTAVPALRSEAAATAVTSLPATATATPAPVQTAPPAAAAQAGRYTLQQEDVIKAQLDSAARAYLQALRANDPTALRPLLAQRCQGSDAAAIVAFRRAKVSRDIGVSIDAAVVINPWITHAAVDVGEAHVFLGLSAGERLLTARPDWWLYENGSWRNAECGAELAALP